MVISASEARNLKPGVMKISVSPIQGRTVPSAAAALSISRIAVVPTGMTRPPAARVALISAAASGASAVTASGASATQRRLRTTGGEGR